MIDKDKQTPFYAMGRFLALYNVLSGDSAKEQWRRVGKVLDTVPRSTFQFWLKDCADKKMGERNPEIVEVLTMFQFEDLPERIFNPVEMGQFQLGYFHQTSECYKEKKH